MDFLRHYLLSVLIFLPSAGAIATLFVRGPRAIKWTALGVFLGTFAVSLLLFFTFDWHAGQSYAYAEDGGVIQMVQRCDWIKLFHIQYLVGIDGLSFPLVLLTTIICLLACVASWKFEESIKAYMVLLLLLESAILGTFLSLDLFLFYFFLELTLVPVYFLITLWGGPQKEYAAVKFFVYSLLGSIVLLIPIIGIELHSGTFDIIKLSGHDFGGPVARTFFILLMIGFFFRLPAVPFHRWLIDAHTQARAPLSMILTGLLLNAGGYGILRIAFPLFPETAKSLAIFIAIIGVISIVYGALCAVAQTDFNRLLAYSSISLMGFVTLGAAMMTETSINGAIFMMIANGISGAALFFIAGIIFDRARHRHIARLGGLFTSMPHFSGLSFVALFAALGVPGLCGFIGEIMVLMGSFQAGHRGGILYEIAAGQGHGYRFAICVWILACAAALATVLTAAYILGTIQRIFLGAERPEYRAMPDLNSREFTVLTPLTVLSIVLGILPTPLFFIFTSPTVSAFVAMLAKSHGR